MTAQVLRVLVIALLFTVSTGLVFPCSKNPALFRLMPTAPRARSAVKQLSAEPCTLDRGSTWSLSSPPASRRSESATGAAGEAGRLPVSEATHDSWIDVVHTAICVGTGAMVFDATPHGARVEIDTPVHGADPLQCPQFELHTAGAVARHPVRRQVSWKDSDSDDEANSDSENGAAWFWNVVETSQNKSADRTKLVARDLVLTHDISLPIVSLDGSESLTLLYGCTQSGLWSLRHAVFV